MHIWIKNLIRIDDPEELLAQVKERIYEPRKIGPAPQNDFSTDIIVEVAKTHELFRFRLEKSICLFFLQMKKGIIIPTETLMFALAVMIIELELKQCSDLLRDWIEDYMPILYDGSEKEKDAYKHVLVAYAIVQERQSKLVEDFWKGLWLDAPSYWWGVSLLGLRIQNPKVTSKELELLAKRWWDDKHFVIYSMWNDVSMKPYMEKVLKTSLIENKQWAYNIHNILLSKITDKDKSDYVRNVLGS